MTQVVNTRIVFVKQYYQNTDICCIVLVINAWMYR